MKAKKQTRTKRTERAIRGTLGATALALAAMVLTATPAAAQAVGATDVDITLPDLVVLHYYSSVDVTLDQTAMANFYTGGGDTYDEGISAPAAAGFTQNLAIGPSALANDPAASTLTLQNAWAVRSISLLGGTDTQLSIALTTPTLNHATTTASLTMTAAVVDDGVSSAATITFPASGLANPTVGDVVLTLDMTNAVNAGDYLNGVYTLTAQNL